MLKLKTLSNTSKEVMPSISPDTKADKYYLTANIKYVIEYEKKQYEFKIIKGFMFDGASIPRILWTTTGHPYQPDYLRAGLVHDYLYRFNPAKIGRKTSDKIFKGILRIDGVGRYQAWKMYQGLRIGGWKAWNDWRKRAGNN